MIKQDRELHHDFRRRFIVAYVVQRWLPGTKGIGPLGFLAVAIAYYLITDYDTGYRR